MTTCDKQKWLDMQGWRTCLSGTFAFGFSKRVHWVHQLLQQQHHTSDFSSQGTCR
jgi:hypothetical protein